MINIQAEAARKLLQIKAIKLSPQNPFVWASGIKSPIYCDNRIVLSYPAVRNFIKQCLWEKSKDFGNFEAVAGVATAGIPHGILLADVLGLPFVYVRDKSKSHGRQNQIEGEVHKGQKILVIEDLISTGGSSIKAVEALQQAECEVIGTLAIFTYNFKMSIALFEQHNCPLDTLTNYDVLIEQAIALDYVSVQDVEMLLNWRQQMQQNIETK